MTAPARLARRLLDVVLPLQHRDVVLSHLDEEYELILRTQSPRSASRWYWRQVTGSLRGAMQMRIQSPKHDWGRPNTSRGRMARLVNEFLFDARYGCRQLRQAPGFSIAAVGMLAIGLGLVAGSYTVVNGMFFRGWDVPDARNVFRASGMVPGAPEGARFDEGLTYGAYKHFLQHGRAADYVAYRYQNRRLGTSQANAVYSSGFYVSDNFIDAIRIPMAQGPGFAGTKVSDGARVVLTDKLWKAVFNGDSGIVGKSIWVSGIPATVVGITAPGFGNLAEREVDFMVDLAAQPLWAMRGRPDEVRDDRTCCINIGGRVRPGVSLESVREELSLLTAQYRQATAQPALVVSIGDTAPVMADSRRIAFTFALVGAAVMLVWGLTCANVGNLILARSLKRSREIAVRLALGASRARLVRQLLSEGLVLAALAGCIALALAAGVPVLVARVDGTAAMFEPDLLVVAVAGLATVTTCVLVSLAPALYATRINLKGTGRTSTAKPGRFREVILAVQVGVAAVLVLAATLLGRGILQSTIARADFNLHTTTSVEFQLPAEAPAERQRAIRTELAKAVATVDGKFGLAEWMPASTRAGAMTSVRPDSGPVEYSAKLMRLSSSAFGILGVPMAEGRTHVDSPEAAEAVVNQTLARRLWPEGGAVGRKLHVNFQDRTFTIVGVLKDAHLTGLTEIEPVVFTSAELSNFRIVLAQTSPGLSETMKALAKQVDPKVTVALTPLSDGAQAALRTAWTGAAVAIGLAAIALVLATIGVFGVFSYLVEERRREIGIRLALGATRRQVRSALAQTCRLPLTMGLALGLGLSVLAGMALRGMLFGLSPLDPVSYAVVAVILIVAAAGATAIPVRRALKVDPAVTLRAD